MYVITPGCVRESWCFLWIKCHHVLLVLGLLLIHCCGLQSQGHGPMADSSGLEGFAHMGLINDLLA